MYRVLSHASPVSTVWNPTNFNRDNVIMTEFQELYRDLKLFLLAKIIYKVNINITTTPGKLHSGHCKYIPGLSSKEKGCTSNVLDGGPIGIVLRGGWTLACQVGFCCLMTQCLEDPCFIYFVWF